MAIAVQVLLLCVCVVAGEEISSAEGIAVSYTVSPTSTVESEPSLVYYTPNMPSPTPSVAATPPQMEPSQTNTEDATVAFSYTEQASLTSSLVQMLPEVTCSSACGESMLTARATKHLTIPITSSRNMATTTMPPTLAEMIAKLPLWVWFVVGIAGLFLFSGCIVVCTTCCYCCTLKNKSASHEVSKEGQRRESVSQLLEKNEQSNKQVIDTESEKKKARPVSRWDSWRNSRRRVSTFKPQLYPTEDFQQQDIIKKPGLEKTSVGNHPTKVHEADVKQSWQNPAQPYTAPATSQTNAPPPPSSSSSSTGQYQISTTPNYGSPNATQQSYGNPSNIYPNYTNSYSASCGIPEGYSNPNTSYSGHENSQADVSALTGDSANGYYNPLFEMKEPPVGTQENNTEQAQNPTFRYSKAMIQKFSQGK